MDGAGTKKNVGIGGHLQIQRALTGVHRLGTLMDHLWRPDKWVVRLPTPKAFRGSSMVEQPAVNRLVVGSNPTRGASRPPHHVRGSFVFAGRGGPATLPVGSIDVEDFRERKGNGGVIGVGLHDVLHVGPPLLHDGRVGKIRGRVIVGEFLHGEEVAGAGVEEDGIVGDAGGAEFARRARARCRRADVCTRLRNRA